MAEIRACRSGDGPALYDICLRTGDAGRDARALYRDPDLLGHIYAGPYAALCPETCFVIADETGVGGYILGTADTARFEARCEAEWWPALRKRYPPPGPLARDRDARLRRLIHRPPRTPPRIAAQYPAHLHIDLLPRLQRQGWGRKLIDTWRAELAALGVPACHLAVGTANPGAIAFYRAYGFDEIARYGAPHNVVYFGIAG